MNVLAFLIVTIIIALLNVKEEDLKSSELCMNSIQKDNVVEGNTKEHCEPGKSITSDVKKVEVLRRNKTYINNWRKMHGYPQIRRRYLP